MELCLTLMKGINIMDFKFGFLVDMPTVNNRIYEREEYQRAIDDFMTTGNPSVMLEAESENYDISKYAGVVKSITINEDNTITADIDIKESPSGLAALWHLREGGNFIVNAFMFGRLGENNVVDSVIIRFLSLEKS